MLKQDTLNQLKQAESSIKEAEAEIKMRQKRLQELIPKKKSIEQECLDKFGCKPEKLPELQKEKVKEVETEAAKLIADINTLAEEG